MENAQIILGGHGACNNFVIGAQGTGGGLYNGTTNYSYNASPDFIGKIVFEPGFGHYEVFGLVRDFRDRIYPGETLRNLAWREHSTTTPSEAAQELMHGGPSPRSTTWAFTSWAVQEWGATVRRSFRTRSQTPADC